MNEFKHTFEELPLLVEDGFEAGLVNGTATICASQEGEWFVTAITLDGYGPGHERKPVEVEIETHQQIYLAIVDRLEHGRFKDSIDDAVQKAMEDQREDGGPRHRSDQEEHSTLNRAQQGV